MKKKDIYRRIIKKKGLRFQFRKLQEECCELGTAINHFLTNRHKGESSLYEEFADVEIMIEQLRPKLDQNRLSKIKNYKINRLKRKIRK